VQVTDKSLALLATLDHLQNLSLMACNSVNDTALVCLKNGSRSLQVWQSFLILSVWFAAGVDVIGLVQCSVTKNNQFSAGRELSLIHLTTQLIPH
jgi:hypothetical protein